MTRHFSGVMLSAGVDPGFFLQRGLYAKACGGSKKWSLHEGRATGQTFEKEGVQLLQPLVAAPGIPPGLFHMCRDNYHSVQSII